MAKNKCILDEENTPDEFPSKLCSNKKKNIDSDAVFLLRKEILCIRSLHSFTFLLRYNLAVNFTKQLQTKSSGRILSNYMQPKNIGNKKT